MKTLSFIRIMLVLVVVGLVGCTAPSLAPTADSVPIADTSAFAQAPTAPQRKRVGTPLASPLPLIAPPVTATPADTGALRQVVQMGHSYSVNSLAFSPNGLIAFSGSEDGTIKTWEVATGKEIRTLRLWDVQTGEEPVTNLMGYTNRRIVRKSGLIKASAFSPDGRFAISLGESGDVVELWDIVTSQKIHTFTEKHTSADPSNYSVTFSSDSRFALSGSDDGTLTMWDVTTGKQIRQFTKYPGVVRAIAISLDGRLAISCNGGFDWNHGVPSNTTSRLWDVATGKEISTLDSTSEVNSVVFSSDGRFILSGNGDGNVQLWDVATGKNTRTFHGHSGGINSVAFSPDNHFALSGSDDGTIKLWEVATGKEIRTMAIDMAQALQNADKKLKEIRTEAIELAQLLDNGEGKLKETRTMESEIDQTLQALRSGKRLMVYSVAFSPDGQTVLAGRGSVPGSSGGFSDLESSRMELWNLNTGQMIRVMQGSIEYISDAAFNLNKPLVLAVSTEGIMRLWNIANGELVSSFGKKIIPSTLHVVLSPSGQLACLADYDVMDVFDIATGKIIGSLKESQGSNDYYKVTRGIRIAFSADNRSIFSWDRYQNLNIWDVATGKRTLSKSRGQRGWIDPISNNVIADGTSTYAACNAETMSCKKCMGKGFGIVNNWMEVLDASTRETIIRMITTTDGEWVTVTPDGYYNTSPEGKSAVHYASATETYSFEQFESLFRRPDIIKARLAGDLTAGTPAPKLTRPPRVTAAPTRSMQTTTDQATYPLAVTATSIDDVVKTVRVFVNGKPALEQPVDAKEQQLNLTVPLFAGPNRITTVAYDSKGFSSNQESIDIVSTVPGAPKPTLYVMAAGVSEYPNMPAADQLNYAHTDANALVQALRDQKGKLFQDVRDLTLVNQEVTLQQLEAGLTALSAMDTNDIAIIFLAGHGVQGKDGKFWYVTPQGSMEHPEHGGLDWQILVDHISRIKGRVILFLDACHSGSIVDETIVPNDQLAAKFFQGGMGGVMVFSASKGRQTSREHSDFGGGHGAFTYAIIQALGEKAIEADKDNNGFVEFMELVDYVSTTVNTLIRGGKQTPWLSRKELFGDLAIAMVKKGE